MDFPGMGRAWRGTTQPLESPSSLYDLQLNRLIRGHVAWLSPVRCVLWEQSCRIYANIFFLIIYKLSFLIGKGTEVEHNQ